jgi:uncharacterized Rmd1/YagE family protein
METISEPQTDAAREMQARALLVGERLDLRAFEKTQRLATSPLTIRAGESGYAVLFRYGAVVLYGLSPLEEIGFMEQLAPLVQNPFEEPETEQVAIVITPGEEGISDEAVVLAELSVERLQAVADILAKSVVLAHSEQDVDRVFERIEPLASGLRSRGKGHRQSRELLNYIGGALLTQHRTVGRAAIVEKPELLWEHPELDRLYHRLSHEYELHERQRALEGKLELIANTAQTLLDLLQNRRSLRVEWYIVILIVVEILLTLYEMFLR